MKKNPAVSDSTRRTLALARTAAAEASAPRIGTEHLLAGLLSEPSNDARAALLQAGGDVSRLPRVEREPTRARVIEAGATLPYSEDAKAAIIACAAEAHQDGHDVALPRHLLRTRC